MHLRFMLASVVVGSMVSHALAQTVPAPSQPQPQPPAAAPASQTQPPLSGPELDALVAPIALYPDDLLAQVLMASTYPLEVVQADRWLAANKKLKGDELKAVAEKQPWDTSVKSLVATPPVLEMMSKNLDWTQKLGDAVLAQQPDVMDGIQRMRSRAYETKKLSTGAQQKVTVRQDSGKQTILIEPTNPSTVYVPYYDPAVVYGSWPYPAYPPYYFPAPGYIATGVIATGLAFGAAYALGRWNNGNYWGGNVNWNNNNINIDRNRVSHWEHNSQHRHGVQYRNDAVRQKFSNNNIRAGSEGRMDFRGRDGGQVLRPDGDRGGAGAGIARPDQRPGDRPGAGARPDRPGGDRPGAGNRPDRPGGDRPSAGQRPDRPGGDRARPGGGSGQPRAATRPNRPNPGANRPGPSRDSAFSMQSGRAANLQSQRGHASMARSPGGGGRAMHAGGGGGARAMGGGGGGRVGGGGGRGGGGRGGGGGGRRSDIQLKHDVVLLGHLDNGLGFYRFAYNGSAVSYVGVIAQEVQGVAPWAVHRGADGYLRVDYRMIGVRFQTLDGWQASGSRIPAGKPGN